MGIAGRTALGFGTRLTGKSRDGVNAELMDEAAQQLFTMLGELTGGAMKVGQVLSVMEAAVPVQYGKPAVQRGVDEAAEGRTAAARGESAPRARCPAGHQVARGAEVLVILGSPGGGGVVWH
jgi:hypothetical protein